MEDGLCDRVRCRTAPASGVVRADRPSRSGSDAAGLGQGSASLRLERRRHVVVELRRDLLEGQRALRATAGGEHLLDDLATVVQPGREYGGELLREDRGAAVVGYDVDLLHQRPTLGVIGQFVGVVGERGPQAGPAEQADRHGVRCR